MDHEQFRKAGPKTVLPFGGLGLDLGAVFVRARVLFLQSARPPGKPFRDTAVQGAIVVSGYELLLRLGREIRGC
jgi:hypothetical protein